MSTQTDLKPPPAGPGRYRDTRTMKPGWQIWDAQAGEWLTVSLIAEFTSGRVRYVCEEIEDGEHITFDTVGGGHRLWSRSSVEQRQAAKTGGASDA